MSSIKLAYIDTTYINYLRQFENKVMYNKGQKRPYIGIIFKVREHDYFAPLSSPKEKFQKMKNSEHFMRIAGGKLGAINFNNMIPAKPGCVNPIHVSQIDDWKYKLLLINQIKFFNEFETEIINRATKLYKNYKSNKLRPEVKKVCCNFVLLEKVAKDYKLKRQ